ncbi:endothelin-converting enzyme 1-like isoform X2 [Leptotrombidium deliense]|uniref:Endothelin-converting enzyme 1-like isoform X2 n=1 Tax=Leptotrombidium deliense TaxID=299467 RepID=A0A443SC60_9ACAR|nr:endothelin-converting enzyme 1-like isoform X2 [Leptotrombidium deliense]
MPEDVESKETDAFTQNRTTSGQQKSKSYMDLRDKNKLMKIGVVALIVFILALLLIIIVLAIVKIRMAKDGEHDDHSNDPDVCHTKKCVETAKYLYDNMDLSVDPCEDFYNYTCRGWGIHNPRPAGEMSWGVNTLVSKNLNKQLLEFRDEYGLEELHKLFKKVGGFPMITENWNDANFDWQKNYVYIDTAINSVSLFFTYKITRELLEDKKQFIEMSPANSFYVGSTLIDPNLKREDKLKAEKNFRDSLKEYLRNLRGYINEASLESDIKAFIDFEKKLATLVEQSQDEEDGDVIAIGEMPTKYKDVFNLILLIIY